MRRNFDRAAVVSQAQKAHIPEPQPAHLPTVPLLLLGSLQTVQQPCTCDYLQRRRCMASASSIARRRGYNQSSYCGSSINRAATVGQVPEATIAVPQPPPPPRLSLNPPSEHAASQGDATSTELFFVKYQTLASQILN